MLNCTLLEQGIYNVNGFTHWRLGAAELAFELVCRRVQVRLCGAVTLDHALFNQGIDDADANRV